MDLYEPGTGFTQQVHDSNGGIGPSGLFWTLRVPDGALTEDGDTATLAVENLAVADSFQILGPNEALATVSFDITWTAFGDTRILRPGSSSPTDPTNLAAQFRDAHAAGTFSGVTLTMPGGGPFSYEGQATDDPLWGEIGTERNGSFLK